MKGKFRKGMRHESNGTREGETAGSWRLEIAPFYKARYDEFLAILIIDPKVICVDARIIPSSRNNLVVSIAHGNLNYRLGLKRNNIGGSLMVEEDGQNILSGNF